jgi:hypothetical protein
LHIRTQPYDRKVCSGFDGYLYRACAGLIFAVFHLPESVHDTGRGPSGNVEIWAKMVSPADFSETRACIAPFAHKE